MATHISKELLQRYLHNQCAPDEVVEVVSVLADGDWDEETQEVIEVQLLNKEEPVESSERLQLILDNIKRSIRGNEPPAVHRVHFLKTAWFKYAAAVLIIAGIGAYLWNTQQKEKPQISQTNPVPVKNDIMPGQDRAILTLSNGQQVELNNATSETINDGSLSIKNSNGQLLYSDSERGSLSSAGGGGRSLPAGRQGGSREARTATNTMTTPRGGQYQLTLSDGTKVWLNAASSITYPVAFAGKTREVQITGEAYFEVASDKSKPFHVKTAAATIEVLGTSFNVNAYEEEPFKTSLVEGAVKISSQILKPGQAFINGKVASSNIARDIAWKNGVFNFQGLTLEAAMRQLARWYDIQVQYDGEVPTVNFGGKIGRDLTLSQVLKIIDGVVIRARLEGRVLHVSKL